MIFVTLKKKNQFNTKKFKKKISGLLIRGFRHFYYTGVHKGSGKAKKSVSH